MRDHLTEFESPKQPPEKIKMVVIVYAVLLVMLIAAIVRAYLLWKRIVHH